MPRQKRRDKINDYHRARIERQAGLLQIALTEAQITLTPFRDHYDAIHRLQNFLTDTINLLNDRPRDYRPPHQAPMSAGK